LKPLITLLYRRGTRVGESVEEERTKTEDSRVVPIPSVLVMMLREIEPIEGKVFDGKNLRTEWEKACAA